MKFRHAVAGGDEKIELQMVPMIDIVFQMLIFFVMTFKIAVPEGDFNITMPINAPSDATPPEDQQLALATAEPNPYQLILKQRGLEK